MRLSRTQKVLAVGAAALVVAAGGAGVALASSDDDAGDRPITGNALKRASEAALAETGSGRVTETEVDDEESYYEVEVTKPDGSQVDVQLDRDFHVVGTKDDGSSAKDAEEG